MNAMIYPIRTNIMDVFESMERDFPEFRETENGYYLTVDLPGVNAANLDLQVEGNRLLINATRMREMVDKENFEQKISRTFLIPEHVDQDKIQANMEDGVLYLALPKHEKAKPRKIEISKTTGSSWKNLLGFGKPEVNTQLA